MHFSKTYTQLLESLPPELQKNTIQYRQLKKIINQIVQELSSLGLSPDLLHKFLDAREECLTTSPQTQGCDHVSTPSSIGDYLPEDGPISLNGANVFPKVVYEFNEASSKIEPRLRILLDSSSELGGFLHIGVSGESARTESVVVDADLHDDDSDVIDGDPRGEPGPHIPPGKSLLWTLQKANLESQISLDELNASNNYEVVIPLVSDSQFFELLYTALERMSAHLKSVEAEFMTALTRLTEVIGDTARPASSSHSILGGNFHAFSPLRDNAGSVDVRRGHFSKSDLYSWREIFRIYVETEVFESVHEQDRGERSVEDSERRLQLFATQVTQRGLAAQGKFKLKESRAALEKFLQLNILILNIKKFQLVNSEATRKILKKHTKRTALRPLPLDSSSSSQTPLQLALIPKASSSSLPRILVQAIGETLLPIIPHLDDYSCVICTSIAFKPIKLNCGHLFCVRCLVKMQKRGKDNCPICRSQCVLIADRSNVDWALMNFMQDWFPIEARKKLKANEKEATAEQLIELGVDPNPQCIIM